jgi:RNA polymerase subunit RPABC4/transcription elongation factor Spt4
MQTCRSCSTEYPGDVAACPHCGAPATGNRPGLPTIVVACTTKTCRAAGIERNVSLTLVGSWLVEAPRLLCRSCGNTVETIREWPSQEDSNVPKITQHGGPSFPPGSPEADAQAAEAEAEADEATPEGAEDETVTAGRGPIDLDEDLPNHDPAPAAEDQWLDYAADRYAVDREWAADEYNKKQLIAAVGLLEDGNAVVVDGHVVTD